MGGVRLHERLLCEFLERRRGFNRKGFPGALRERFGDLKCHFLPDAYKIDDSAEVVILAEVQVTSPITAAKAQEIIDLFWAIDERALGWVLGLVVIDRCGIERIVDMAEFVYAHLSAPPEPGFSFPWADEAETGRPRDIIEYVEHRMEAGARSVSEAA